jgi:hypothetical protein
MNPKLTTTSRIFSLAVFAFILGGTTAKFNGGKWAWIAAIGCIIGVAVSSYSLLRDVWKADG